MTDSDAIARLALYRLEQDLSYVQLAADVTEAGFPISSRTLYVALTGRGLRGQSRERTRFKIRRFVEIKIVGSSGDVVAGRELHAAASL